MEYIPELTVWTIECIESKEFLSFEQEENNPMKQRNRNLTVQP
jgi:hypothetical protein